ncbi:hypothetical protein BZA77DRAFT_326099 [Pyronema omphalodes]|nr:hypothetical protein BZA77DRAFT_326099 [Pyronema omphalodes]
MQYHHDNFANCYDQFCTQCITRVPSITSDQSYQQASASAYHSQYNHGYGNATTGLPQSQIAGPSATFHEGADYDGKSFRYVNPATLYASHQQSYEIPYTHDPYPSHDQHNLHNRQEEQSISTRKGKSRTIQIKIQRDIGSGNEDSNGYRVSTRVSGVIQRNPTTGQHFLDAQRTREGHSRALVNGWQLEPPDPSHSGSMVSSRSSGSSGVSTMVSSRSSGSSGFPTNLFSGSNPRDYCTICGRNIKNLRRHIVEVHGDPEVLYCPVEGCERSIDGGDDGFKRRANMKTHLKGRHGEGALLEYEDRERRMKR